MIKIIQRAFQSVVAQKRVRFIPLPSLISINKVSLNYIPSIHFSFQNQKKYMTIDSYGNASLNRNMSESQALQEWQKDIIIQIKKCPEITDKREIVHTLFNVVGFYSTYMNCLIQNNKLIFSIDKQINDFLEIKFQDIEHPFSQESEINCIHLSLDKLKIQANFLQNFEKIELSEKIKLYQEYQNLHQKTLELEEKNYQIIKIQSCIMAQTLFIYLAQKWIQNKVEPNGIRQVEFVKYALEQLVKIFDGLQTINAQDQEKAQYIQTVLQFIYFIFDNFKLFYFSQTKSLILYALSKSEKAFQQFRNILPFDYYISFKINLIREHIKLGYIHKALKIAEELYELRPKIGQTMYAISYDIMFYYCLRKTESKNYDLDDLLQKINPEGLNEEDQIHYNLLIHIQQLHKFIMQEKYEELLPIITEILKVPFKSSAQIQFLLPLLSDEFIYHPQIPNQLAFSQFLLSQFPTSQIPDDSKYLAILRELQKSMLQFMVALEKGDNEYTKLSQIIPFFLMHSKQDTELESEIIRSFVKFIPLVSSEKTYKLLTDIVDQCISQIQQFEYNDANGKLLEILNQQKNSLRLKYFKN